MSNDPTPESLRRPLDGTPAGGSADARLGSVRTRHDELALLDDESLPVDALARLADDRVVDALLEGLATVHGGRAAALVDGAFERLSEQTAAGTRRRLVPGRGQRSAPTIRRWTKLVPILLIAVAGMVVGQIASRPGAAIADPVDIVVSAGSHAGARRYEVVIERDGAKRIVLHAAVVDLAPAGTKRADGTRIPPGRFLLRFGANGRSGEALGFDGSRYWHKPAGEEPITTSATRSAIARRSEWGAIVPLLFVERTLKLYHDSSYLLSTEAVPGASGLIRTTMRRREGAAAGSAAPRSRPAEIAFESKQRDRIVTRLELRWPTSAEGRSLHPAKIRSVQFTLMTDQAPPPDADWFTPERHAGLREILPSP